MKEIVTYLTFDGDCGPAMTFYRDCLGGELTMMTFADMPNCPEASKDRIMHAKLTLDGGTLMASDTMPGKSFTQGTNFSISLDFADREEEKKFFDALSQGGTITMPLQDTFWGAHFGMLTDKFGIGWMFNCDES